MYKKRLQTVNNLKKDLKQRGLDADNFCIVPFNTLIFEPNGNVGVCRHKGTDFPVGNIQDSTIEEIWNGPFLRQWRKEFLEGKPKICDQEVKHIHCNLGPESYEFLDETQLKEVQETPFLKLTANFNGKCNLQCQMCDVWKLPNGLYDDINFWEPAKREIFPVIKEVDMLSGEPFIQQDTYRLINEISEVNPSCRWSFTTNAHWRLNDRIKGALDKIDVKWIVLSVDSLNEQTYAKIRYPGNIRIVLENIDRLLEYNESRKERGLSETTFHLNFLAQKDNWQEVPDIISYCLDKGILPFVTYLFEPDQFSLTTFEDNQKKEILDYYYKTLDVLTLNRIMRILSPLTTSLMSIDKAEYLLRLKDLRKSVKEKIEAS